MSFHQLILEESRRRREESSSSRSRIEVETESPSPAAVFARPSTAAVAAAARPCKERPTAIYPQVQKVGGSPIWSTGSLVDFLEILPYPANDRRRRAPQSALLLNPILHASGDDSLPWDDDLRASRHERRDPAAKKETPRAHARIS